MIVKLNINGLCSSDLKISKTKFYAANKIFDIIWISCPTLLLPKILLKGIWKLKFKWDEEVPLEI